MYWGESKVVDALVQVSVYLKLLWYLVVVAEVNWVCESSLRAVQPETLGRKKTAKGQNATSYLRAVYCTFGFMLFHARLKRLVTLYSQFSPSNLPTRS